MDEAMHATAEATETPRGIPVDLAPLLSPYRRYEQLSLRIERLPSRARFSRGSNNGDRTWSLTPDQLDGNTVGAISRSTAQGGFVGSLVSRDQSSAMVTADLNDALESEIREHEDDYLEDR